MQDNATSEQQIVHHAIEFIGARDVHKEAVKTGKPDQQIDAARDAKHAKERALDKAVKSAARKAKAPPTHTR